MLAATFEILRRGPHAFRWDPDSTPFASVTSPAVASVVYLATLFLLKQRPGNEIRIKAFGVFHNGLLVIWAFTILCGMIYGAFERVTDDGGMGPALLCTQRPPSKIWDGTLGYFTYLFYLSKYWELIDTFILALRKKPTICLHVYHHAIMLFIVWSWFAYPWLEAAWWCSLVNSFIHTLMYYYYMVTVLGINPWWKKLMTSMQIIQFVTGCVFVGIYFYFHYFGHGCTSNPLTAWFSLTVNFSFLYLFSRFFKKSYGGKGQRERAD